MSTSTHRLPLVIAALLVVTIVVLAMLALVDAPAAAREGVTSRPAAPTTPTTVVPPASSVAPEPAPTPRTTSAPLPVERVLVVGDSITQSAQEPIVAALEAEGVQVRVLAWGGTAPCDWIDPVTTEVEAFDPDVVLIEFAGNDLTPCIADTPRSHPDFVDRYTVDATALTDAAKAAGATVRWSSVPFIAHDDHEAVARQLNEVYRSLSDDGVLTPLRAALTVDGGFGLTDRCRATAECGDAPAFTPVQIRSDDGLHLAEAGSVRMASVYGQVVHRLAV